MHSKARWLLMYVFHLLVAIMGVAVGESSVHHLFPKPTSVDAVVVRSLLTSIVIAAGLAVLMRIKFPSQAACWVWVLPVSLRLPFVFLLSRLGWLESLGLRQGPDNKMFMLAFAFSLVVVRAVAYSIASNFALRSPYLAAVSVGRREAAVPAHK